MKETNSLKIIFEIWIASGYEMLKQMPIVWHLCWNLKQLKLGENIDKLTTFGDLLHLAWNCECEHLKKSFNGLCGFHAGWKNNGNIDHCVNCVICTQCIWDCLGHWLDQVNVSDNPPKTASEVFIIFLEVFLCLEGGFSIRLYMDLESNCWDAITSKNLYILSYISAMSNHYLKTIHWSEKGYCFIYWQAAVK